MQAAHNHGIRRVLMANQLVGRAMAIIARILRQDPDFTYFCIIDSPANAAHLGACFGEQGLTLPVLIELGPAGGRTGVRDDAQFRRWPTRSPAGPRWPWPASKSTRACCRKNRPSAPSCAAPPARCAAWPKRAACAERPGADLRRRLGLVRRGGRGILEPGYRRAAGRGAAPGCYLSHDVASTARPPSASTHNPVARKMDPGLQPALQVWAYVQSLPEPGRAIIALGKRDAASTPACARPSATVRPGRPGAPAHWKLTAMMDQHAFMQISEGDDIQVGDMIAFDISHPCLTFDKWRQVLLVDEQYRVIDVAETFSKKRPCGNAPGPRGKTWDGPALS